MHVISSMQKQVNCDLPDDVKMIVSSTSKKLSTFSNVKDKTVFNHKRDINIRSGKSSTFLVKSLCILASP